MGKEQATALTAGEMAALMAVYRVYRAKKKVERKVIEGAFYRATGKKLGKKYYGVAVVRMLLDLSR